MTCDSKINLSTLVFQI